MGDRLLAGTTALGDHANRERLVAYQPQDLLSLRRSKGCEHFFGCHSPIVTPISGIHKLSLVDPTHKRYFAQIRLCELQGRF